MAVSPQIQSLIDILHASPRGDDWAGNVAEQYNAALASIELNMPDALPEDVLVIKNDGLQEVLCQHVDADILPSVMELFELPPAEGFEEALAEQASAWPEDLQVYTEEEFEVGGLRPSPAAAEIDAGTAGQMQEAARDGSTAEIMSMLLILNQQGRDGERVPYLGDDANVAGSLTPVGKTLFDYVKDKIYQANSQLDPMSDSRDADGNLTLINNRPFTPPGGQYREGTLITLSPAEMKAMIRTEIFQDIQNGTFPIPGLDPTDAERIADLLYDKAFSQSERTGSDVGGSGPGTVLNYAFSVQDRDLADAIDTMFIGDNPVLKSTVQVGLNKHQFTQEYTKVMDVRGGAMTADDLIEHFTNLVEGDIDETVSPPEVIPPVMNVPEHMREQFYGAIRESYEASRRVDPDDPTSLRTSYFDPDVFGRKMEDRFGQIDAEHTASPQNRNALDYGQEMRVALGAETENGFQVVNEAGELMFEIDLSNGFALYNARDNGEHLIMDEMRDVDTKEQLRELIGDEGFTIQAVSPLDEDLDTTDTSISGYYIAADSTGNSFHVGFDAIPEATVSPEFREARDSGFDTRDAAPDIAVRPDLVIGQAVTPEDPPEVRVAEGPPPVGAPGAGPF